MKIVCISDTHGRKCEVPAGDILIHAGDLTVGGTYMEVAAAGNWLADLPHKHKLIVPGNHDMLFQINEPDARAAIGDRYDGKRVLIDQLVEVEGFKVWGSPWTPRFYDWAFQLEDSWSPKRADAARPFLLDKQSFGELRTSYEHWATMPEDIDILITHGPPYGWRDRTTSAQKVGDVELAKRLNSLPRLQLHVFGHIHASYGMATRPGAVRLGLKPQYFVNACICDEAYRAVNRPITVECEPPQGPAVPLPGL